MLWTILVILLVLWVLGFLVFCSSRPAPLRRLRTHLHPSGSARCQIYGVLSRGSAWRHLERPGVRAERGASPFS
jgi:hypothetical protein